MKFSIKKYQKAKVEIDKVYNSLKQKPNFVLKIWETEEDRDNGNSAITDFDPEVPFVQQIDEIESRQKNYAATEIWWQTPDGDFRTLWSNKFFDDSDQFDFDYETVRIIKQNITQNLKVKQNKKEVN